MEPKLGAWDTALRDRAMDYAAQGVRVFPCVPDGKTPLTRNGFHDATTDFAVIADWWDRHPRANIATPTGAPGFDVLDVDVRPNGTGWASFHQANQAGLLDGWLRAVRTPSVGLHLHYPGTAQRNGSISGHHLDFRSHGGYVLLPPSQVTAETYTGGYSLLRSQDGPGRTLDWAALTALLAPPPPAPAGPTPAMRSRPGVDATEYLAGHVARQPEGNRDNALFWAACRAAEAHIPDPEPLVTAAIHAGLPEHQARRTVRSAYDTIARQPTRCTPAVLAAPPPARAR